MRVIAGTLKGRRLDPPTWEGVRPTSDKLRETLFNVVALRVRDARVLDAYAGTGAIGIEAMSRGAAHVTFADRDPRALKLIAHNLQRCGVSERYVIIRAHLGDARSSEVLRPTGPFDLAVLDPPYDEPDAAAAIGAVEPAMDEAGLLVFEHARRRPSPEAAGRLARTRVLESGDSALSFYEFGIR